jgi:hypothetical protein
VVCFRLHQGRGDRGRRLTDSDVVKILGTVTFVCGGLTLSRATATLTRATRLEDTVAGAVAHSNGTGVIRVRASLASPVWLWPTCGLERKTPYRSKKRQTE